MDAVEKVARALFVSDYPYTSLPEGRFPESVIHRGRYMRTARNLLAAFPQLALEGREEWGARLNERWRIPAADRATADERCQHVRGATTQHRIVYETEWSEVQS